MEPTAPDSDGNSAEARIQQGAALAEMDGHFHVLSACLQEMLGLSWWRIGEKAFRPLPGIGAHLSAFRTSAPIARDEWRTLQATCYKHLETPGQDEAQFTIDQDRALQAIDGFFRLLLRMERSPWWQCGLLVRKLAGRLGLAPAQFEMASERAREEHERFLRYFPPAPANPPNAISDGQAETISLERETPGIYAVKLETASSEDPLPSIAWMQGRRNHAIRHALQALSARSDWPLVSIVMPAYNRAHLLMEALQSIREQHWPAWELLVCDDGSEDNTGALLQELHDDRVRVLTLDHGGAARARNAGLAAAQGGFIAYLDTDNLWDPYYLSVLMARLLERPEQDVIYSNFFEMVIDGSDNVSIRPARPRPFNNARLVEKNYIDLNTILHRRRIYDALGGFDESLPQFQDWDLMLKFAAAAEPLYVDAPLALYRVNPGWSQISFTQAAGRFQNREKVLSNLAAYRSAGNTYKRRFEEH